MKITIWVLLGGAIFLCTLLAVLVKTGSVKETTNMPFSFRFSLESTVQNIRYYEDRETHICFAVTVTPRETVLFTVVPCTNAVLGKTYWF